MVFDNVTMLTPKVREGNIRTISKAVSIQVAPAGRNETERNAIENQIKLLILFEWLIGINRVYLLTYRRVFHFFCLVFGLIVNLTVVYNLIAYTTRSATFKVIQSAGSAEYILLVAIAMLSKKSTLQTLFSKVNTFDKELNIEQDLDTTLPAMREMIWLLTRFLILCIEYFALLVVSIGNITFSEIAFVTATYITFMCHFTEHQFFCALLRTIFLRVRILKAHVAKALAPNSGEPKNKLGKVEGLSNKAELDIHSLHRNYELLHKCADRLNDIMSLPMMIMLVSSGVCTIMLLKSLFKTWDLTGGTNLRISVFIYSITRCIEYTVMVLAPCYYSSVTTSQVAQIRTMLHDAINLDERDKLERRRIKDFFHLTRESEFAYALWGVIRLNMSLPLSYLSLCTTYLIIVIQFSKFID